MGTEEAGPTEIPRTEKDYPEDAQIVDAVLTGFNYAMVEGMKGHAEHAIVTAFLAGLAVKGFTVQRSRPVIF